MVDLCGKTDIKYGPDVTTCIYSSGKTVAAITLAIFKDRTKSFSYDDKISKYWPEFSQNGKQDISISQLLKHEAGLQKFSHQLSFGLTQT